MMSALSPAPHRCSDDERLEGQHGAWEASAILHLHGLPSWDVYPSGTPIEIRAGF